MQPERKVVRALVHVWLRQDDVEGARSCAYDATFDAARAALMVVATALGRHLVVTVLIDPALGRSWNQPEKRRLSADDLGHMPAAEEGGWAIEQAEAFIDGIARTVPDL